jgi:hypothetical protein
VDDLLSIHSLKHAHPILRRTRAAGSGAAKPSDKITTKQKPSGVFTGRDNAKFTAMSALPPESGHSVTR